MNTKFRGSFSMLIYGIKEHFPVRFSEWANAAMLFAWGLYVLAHPDLFSAGQGISNAYTHLAQMSWVGVDPELSWGLTTLSAGLSRLAALFVNGAYSRTPIIRLITAAISAFVWAQIVIGLFAVPNVSIVVYSGLVAIDIVSAYRAAQDATICEKRRQQRVEGAESARSRKPQVV